MPKDETARKLERYLRELTRWGEEMARSVAELERRVGGEGGGGRDPGGPPPPPDLGTD